MICIMLVEEIWIYFESKEVKKICSSTSALVIVQYAGNTLHPHNLPPPAAPPPDLRLPASPAADLSLLSQEKPRLPLMIQLQPMSQCDDSGWLTASKQGWTELRQERNKERCSNSSLTGFYGWCTAQVIALACDEEIPGLNSPTGLPV